MNFVKLVIVIFSVSLFLGFANTGICLMSNSSDDEMSTLAELELSLEMSYKDYHLELASDSPDKAKLSLLKLKIATLSTRIDKMNSLASLPGSRFGILPENFEMEMNAALASEDFERIRELLYNLRLKGNEAVRLEAANLHNLHRQLRFIAVHENGCCHELDTAIADLDGMINTIRA